MGKAERLFIDGVEFNYQRFEDSTESADTILYYHKPSSTVGPALMSSLTIICLDSGYEVMTSNMKDFCLKRCRRVSFNWDENMRVDIIEVELKEALADW